MFALALCFISIASWLWQVRTDPKSCVWRNGNWSNYGSTAVYETGKTLKKKNSKKYKWQVGRRARVRKGKVENSAQREQQEKTSAGIINSKKKSAHGFSDTTMSGQKPYCIPTTIVYTMLHTMKRIIPYYYITTVLCTMLHIVLHSIWIMLCLLSITTQ